MDVINLNRMAGYDFEKLDVFWGKCWVVEIDRKLKRRQICRRERELLDVFNVLIDLEGRVFMFITERLDILWKKVFQPFHGATSFHLNGGIDGLIESSSPKTMEALARKPPIGDRHLPIPLLIYPPKKQNTIFFLKRMFMFYRIFLIRSYRAKPSLVSLFTEISVENKKLFKKIENGC